MAQQQQSGMMDFGAQFGYSVPDFGQMNTQMTQLRSELHSIPGWQEATTPAAMMKKLQLNALEFTYQVIGQTDSNQIASLQNGLVQAGFISPGGFQPGIVDGGTYGAAYGVAFEAAKRGLTPQQLIKQMIAFNKKHGFGAFAPSPEELARRSAAQGRVESVANEYTNVYFSLWGTLPPEGYVKSRMNSMNIFEFEAAERGKPAFEKSPKYQAERISLEAGLAAKMGLA